MVAGGELGQVPACGEACPRPWGQWPGWKQDDVWRGCGARDTHLVAPALCTHTLHTHRTCPLPLEHKGSHPTDSHLGRCCHPTVTACRAVTHTPGTHVHSPTQQGTQPHDPSVGPKGALGSQAGRAVRHSWPPFPDNGRCACLDPALARGAEGHTATAGREGIPGESGRAAQHSLREEGRTTACSSASVSPPAQ